MPYWKSTLSLLICILLYGNSFAQVDSVKVPDGNYIRGSIANLKQGTLSMSTSYSKSNFRIAWNKVVEIRSDRIFVFTLSTGDRYKGSILPDTTNEESIIINNNGFFYEIDKELIIEFVPIQKKFLNRLAFSVDFGYTLSRSNLTQQLNVNSNISYKTENSSLNISGSFIRSYLQDQSTTKRSEINLAYRYYLSATLFALSELNLYQNEEQELDLRSTGQTGLGLYLIRNNSTVWSTYTGIAYNNEQYTTSENPSINSGEYWIGSNLDIFNQSRINFSIKGNTYYGITIKDRFRANLETEIRLNLIWNLYFKINYKYNFDSKPPVNAINHAYVLITSLGWSL